MKKFATLFLGSKKKKIVFGIIISLLSLFEINEIFGVDISGMLGEEEHKAGQCFIEND